MAPSLWSALTYRLKQPGLTKDDRAHIKRWFVEADRRVWKQLAAATTRYGELPAVVEGPYSIFIGRALSARRFAESQTDTPAVERKRKQQRAQQDHLDLLALAEKMDDVVRHRQSCRKAQHPQRVPSPTGPLPDLPQEAEAKRSLEWLGREASRLRRLAEKEASSSADLPRQSPRASRIGTGARSPSASAGRVVERESTLSHENWVCSCRRWSTACSNGVGSRVTLPLPR
jgi:hypothetical protein